MTEAEGGRELGKVLIGALRQPGNALSGEDAKIHRELAIGNFFVTLRGVVGVAGKLLQHVLEQEAQ